MKKWNPLNMEVRTMVISHVLRLEETSSTAIKAMLRMFNKKSKTLGNQSSALSFKSKMDLLYDLEELDDKTYKHSIKMMEIRNQFAHNADAVSFESLDGINPEINKYLLNNAPKKVDESLSREQQLRTVFKDLFVICAGRLMTIEQEYVEGMEKEMRRFINDKVVTNIDEIWKNAQVNYRKNVRFLGLPIKIMDHSSGIDDFYTDFKMALHQYSLDELKKLDGNIAQVFKQKKTIDEIVAELEKDAAKDQERLSDEKQAGEGG